MLVKRTSSGKIRLELSLDEREIIAIATLQTSDSDLVAPHNNFISEQDVLRHLHASLLTALIAKVDFKLHVNNSTRWLLTRPEAISLMWALRRFSDMRLVNIKSRLHQTLIG